MADDARQRELLQAAIRKRQAGQKLNRDEQRALDRAGRERDEQLRHEHYRTVPKKMWSLWSGRQHKVLAEQAITYGLPIDGPTIDLPRVVRWLHEMLATNGRKLLAGDAAEDIYSGGDASSPALERLREVQYEIKRRELAVLDGELVHRERTRKVWGQVATILRHVGETLERQFGSDALDLLSDGLADAERAVEAAFGDAEAAEETEAKGGDDQ